MSALTFKHGEVKIQGMNPVMWFVIDAFRTAFNELAPNVDVVVTEIMPTVPHSARSLHNAGMGVDFRSNELPDDAVKTRVLLRVKELVGHLGFDIILERRGDPREHYHAEYQPRTENVLTTRKDTP